MRLSFTRKTQMAVVKTASVLFMRVDTIAIGIWTDIGSPALATVFRRVVIIDLYQSFELREVQSS